jgi:hypothetical protein
VHRTQVADAVQRRLALNTDITNQTWVILGRARRKAYLTTEDVEKVSEYWHCNTRVSPNKKDIVGVRRKGMCCVVTCGTKVPLQRAWPVAPAKGLTLMPCAGVQPHIKHRGAVVFEARYYHLAEGCSMTDRRYYYDSEKVVYIRPESVLVIHFSMVRPKGRAGQVGKTAIYMLPPEQHEMIMAALEVDVPPEDDGY